MINDASNIHHDQKRYNNNTEKNSVKNSTGTKVKNLRELRINYWNPRSINSFAKRTVIKQNEPDAIMLCEPWKAWNSIHHRFSFSSESVEGKTNVQTIIRTNEIQAWHVEPKQQDSNLLITKLGIGDKWIYIFGVYFSPTCSITKNLTRARLIDEIETIVT